MVNTTMTDSGCSGYFLAALASSLSLQDCYFNNPSTGSGVYVVCAQCTARVENSHMTGGRTEVSPGYRILTDKP